MRVLFNTATNSNFQQERLRVNDEEKVMIDDINDQRNQRNQLNHRSVKLMINLINNERINEHQETSSTS